MNIVKPVLGYVKRLDKISGRVDTSEALARRNKLSRDFLKKRISLEEFGKRSREIEKDLKMAKEYDLLSDKEKEEESENIARGKIVEDERVKSFRKQIRKQIKIDPYLSQSSFGRDISASVEASLKFRKGLSRSSAQLKRSIVNQGFDLDARKKSINARRIELARRSTESHNFFKHRDPIEVYGDDGLTFFDSNKSRGSGSTGRLFGFR